MSPLSETQERHCRTLASRFHIPGYEREDLEQEARLAMLRDPEGGWLAARNRLVDLLRIHKGRKGTNRANAIHLPLFEHDFWDTDDELERVEERLDAELRVRRLRPRFKFLSPLQREALAMAARGEPRPHNSPHQHAFWRAQQKLKEAA